MHKKTIISLGIVCLMLFKINGEVYAYQGMDNKYNYFIKNKEELECLAKNIFFEAGSEEYKGKLAVGYVTLNRIEDKEYPDTICDVVKQRKSSRKCQFSWYCDGRSDDVPRRSRAWKASIAAAISVLTAPKNDITKGAISYHALSVHPYWADKMKMVIRIDGHIFYTRKS